MMTREEIRETISEVLAEQKRLHEDDIDGVVLRTITTLLTSFGIEEEDRREMQADFRYLRRWRRSIEQTQTFAFKTIISVIVTGFIGVLWLGVKVMLGK